MKLFIVFFVLGCLVVTNIYGFDPETKNGLIDIYNLTTNLYALIVGLLDDLSNKKITTDLAEDKIDGWKTRYGKETDPVPHEAEKMCGSMNKMIDMARDIVREYQPDNQKTKDLLKELEEVKSELKKEINELKYVLQ